MLVETHNLRHITTQPLPGQLDGQYSARTSLEMGMIGRRCATLRTIIKYQHLRILLKQLVYLTVFVVNLLWLVLHAGNGEVDRQDGEGVHQQVILIVDVLLYLLLRAILLAEETGACCHRFLIDAGTCRDHTGRIPLYLHGGGSHRQLACLHIAQLTIALAGIIPLL